MSQTVPSDLFGESIGEKKIYYFSSNKLNTPEPHNFICIKREDNGLLIMNVCTTKRATIENYVERSKLPYETIVWISPNDPANPFKYDTYINCNSPFNFTVDELKVKYEAGEIEFRGEISEVHYEQILIGLHISPVVDEEIKEVIPKP